MSLRERSRTDHVEPAMEVDLFSQPPQIDRSAVHHRHFDPCYPLLLVEDVKLLEKVDTGAGRRLHRIQTLQPGLETKSLSIGNKPTWSSDSIVVSE